MDGKYVFVIVVVLLVAGSVTFSLIDGEKETREELQPEGTEFPTSESRERETHEFVFDGDIEEDEIEINSGDKILFVNNEASSYFVEVNNATGKTVQPGSESEIPFNVEPGSYTMHVSGVGNLEVIVN